MTKLDIQPKWHAVAVIKNKRLGGFIALKLMTDTEPGPKDLDAIMASHIEGLGWKDEVAIELAVFKTEVEARRAYDMLQGIKLSTPVHQAVIRELREGGTIKDVLDVRELSKH